MSIDDLFNSIPPGAFTKKEREWLKMKLKTALKTVQAVQGRNVSITNGDNGQTINAADCQPCP